MRSRGSSSIDPASHGSNGATGGVDGELDLWDLDPARPIDVSASLGREPEPSPLSVARCLALCRSLPPVAYHRIPSHRIAYHRIASHRIVSVLFAIMASRRFGTTEHCLVCRKPVYAQEKHSSGGNIFHKACFRCSHEGCSKVRRSGSTMVRVADLRDASLQKQTAFSLVEGKLYCSTHAPSKPRRSGTLAGNP